ncbi:MAG: tRNA (adenosine(37)-N6)-dimethylallyltransferase MiaA [Eubacterium sp.]|nr:tRNA (adenosine(37)-N6)-dimethylallyltransferase MiaA [Eubacterium sp.]
MEKQKIPVVVGPTASGKTGAAVALAKLRGGEVISADSMQIYRHMDIGTAKPTAQEMAGIPHHLIDCVDPDEAYSVARFKEEALAKIEDILDRGRQPIVAGGTGLYVNGLTLPWGFREKDTDETVRKKLEAEAAQLGAEALHKRLAAADPKSAAEIHPNNVKRVIRALEIYQVTGKAKSQLDAEARVTESLPYNYVLMGIAMPRERLYDRVNRRVDLMVEQGLEAELRDLMSLGYSPELPALKAIGYKELFPYLRGEMTLEAALEILKRDTRHFAKRQLTWFRKDQRITWFDAEVYPEADAMAQAMQLHFEQV